MLADSTGGCESRHARHAFRVHICQCQEPGNRDLQYGECRPFCRGSFGVTENSIAIRPCLFAGSHSQRAYVRPDKESRAVSVSCGLGNKPRLLCCWRTTIPWVVAATVSLPTTNPTDPTDPTDPEPPHHSSRQNARAPRSRVTQTEALEGEYGLEMERQSPLFGILQYKSMIAALSSSLEGSNVAVSRGAPFLFNPPPAIKQKVERGQALRINE